MAGMHLPSKKAKAVSRAGPGQRPQREAAGQRGLGTTTSGPHRSQSASDAGQSYGMQCLPFWPYGVFLSWGLGMFTSCLCSVAVSNLL